MSKFATDCIRTFLQSRGVDVSEGDQLSQSEVEAYTGIVCMEFACTRESVISSLTFIDSLQPQAALDAVMAASVEVVHEKEEVTTEDQVVEKTEVKTSEPEPEKTATVVAEEVKEPALSETAEGSQDADPQKDAPAQDAPKTSAKKSSRDSQTSKTSEE